MLVDFARRAQGLIQHAMEAFALLASRECITVSEAGGIQFLPRKVSPQPLGRENAEQCRVAAAILGRDFAQINDRVTIYTSLSIRP